MQWVDALRGFSMLMVVFGHVLVYSGINSSNSPIIALLITFRMPLFFFVSGFFSYRLYTWWNRDRVADIVKRKVQAQILGTIAFCAVYQYVINGAGIGNGFGAYWFTIVLFQMYMTYLLLSLLSCYLNRNVAIPLMIVLSVVFCGIIFVNKLDFRLARIFSWLNLAEYMQFFTLGLLCNKYRDVFLKVLGGRVWITIFIMGWIACMLIMYSEWMNNNSIFIASLNRNLIVRYCGLFCVITLFFRSAASLSAPTKGARLLRFIGRRTLDIYFIHYFFLPQVEGISEWLTQDNRIIFQIILASVVTCAVTAMSLLVSGVLRSSPILASWLLGVKPST